MAVYIEQEDGKPDIAIGFDNNRYQIWVADPTHDSIVIDFDEKTARSIVNVLMGAFAVRKSK